MNIMVYFYSLSAEAQNIVMLNFDFFAKKILLAAALIWSIIYVFIIRKKQEKSPFLLVSYLRTSLYVTAAFFLWVSPFTIFLLYPQVPVDLMYKIMIAFYGIGFSIVAIVIMFNIFYLGPLILVKWGGFEADKKRTDAVIKKVFGKKLSGMLKKIQPKYAKNFKNDQFDPY